MGFRSDQQIDSVVIAGAGGFALEVFDYVSSQARHGGPAVAGFVDDSPSRALPKGIGSEHFGKIADYRPVAGQVVVVAIGSVTSRRAVLQTLWSNAVATPAFVGADVIVSPASIVGTGSIICPFSIINRNAELHDGVLVNVHCSVGHGAQVGAHSVLSPFAALNGDSAVGAGCFLGTRATIYPRIRIGDDCVVDSHCGVRANAESGQMISSRGAYVVSRIRRR
jgi:UDP-3-O-[3-hydroxymyristoyl] glucosamine N-acyltransferase